MAEFLRRKQRIIIARTYVAMALARKSFVWQLAALALKTKKVVPRIVINSKQNIKK